MTQYAIVTDLNRCVGCLACSAACKTMNDVPIGNFWIKVMRVGPVVVEGKDTSKRPNIETYFLPTQCQHCENPECVDVCPTGASYKAEDGTIQIDEENCIGCMSCMSACPYGVRYLNEETNVVQKCTLCKDRIDNGELPQCVAQCSGRARWFGDLEAGIESFEGPANPRQKTGDDASYDAVHNQRAKLVDYVQPFTDADVHHLTDEGNVPAMRFILRGRTWQGEE